MAKTSSDRIKGISIAINGDTTELQKALKDVNDTIALSQNKLRDLDKLLKLDPGNTELLKQKYETLGKEIDSTKEKLKTLKNAEAQMQDAGETDTAKWDNLQREIIATEQDLEGLNAEMAKFGTEGAEHVATVSEKMEQAGSAMQDVGSKLKDTGSKVSGVGKKITAGVTLPIVGIGTAAVASFKEVDEAMDTVVTKTGASGETLEDMQKRVENIAQTIPTSFQTAADAVGEVNTRFGLTGDALEDISSKFVRFAQLNDTDVSGSVDKVQSAMAAFNVPAENAGEVLDLLNVAGQNTGVSMDTLTSQLTTNASGLKALGFNLSDSTMLLANLSKEGVDTSSAMTGLKKAYAESLKDGTSLNEKLKELETGLQNNSTHSQAAAEAIELFGSKAGGALVDALTEGRVSFEQLGTSLSEYAGSVETTFNETLDPIDQMQTTLNTLKTVGADLVTTAGPIITTFMQGLADIVRKLSDLWNGLNEGQQQTIIKVGLLVAAIGPVITIIGTLMSSIGSIITVGGKIISGVSKLGGVLKTLWGVLSANPVMLVVTAIAALVAGFLYLWENCEGFREFWINLWDKIKEIVSKAVEGIKNFFSGIVDFVKNNWDGLLTLIVNPFAGAFKLLYDNCDKFREFVDNFIAKVKEGFTNAWNNIKDGISTAWNGIKTTISNVINGIKTTISNGLNAAKTTVTNVLNGIKTAFSNIWNGVKSVVTGAIDKIKGLMNFKWELPKLKLPHFSITGKFSLDPPSIPHISVDWYKKAMDNGMILNQPTIFGAAGGKLLGAGEAGPEAVVGTSSLRSMIQESIGTQLAALADSLGGDTYVYIGNEQIDAIIQKANQRMNLRSGGR